MVSTVTNRGKFESANLDSDAADLRLIYVDTPPASVAAAQDFNFVADVVADEVAGAARADLAGLALSENDTDNRAELDATDPPTLSGLNGPTIAGAWVYRQVTNDADSPVWGFLDSNDVVTNGGDVTPAFPAGGFLHWT